MGVTLKEIAEKAEVSIGTVSRVANNLGYVKPETRDRVRAVMEEMRYSPARLRQARELPASRSVARRSVTVKLLGGMQIIFGNSVFANIAKGIEEVMRRDGSHLLVQSLPEEFDPVYAPEAVLNGVDGVLFCAGVPEEYLRHVKARKIPCVRLQSLDTREARAMSFVAHDNIPMAMELVRYLAGLGHRKIAFISQSAEWGFARERRAGYAAGLAEAGIHFRAEYCVEAPSRFPASEEVCGMMDALLGLPHPPTAVFCCTDGLAFGAMRRCLEIGLSLPGDMSFVGYDNSSDLSHPGPALTTVGQSETMTGQVAAQELLASIRDAGHVPRKIVLPAELYIRQSATVPRGLAKLNVEQSSCGTGF